MTQRNLTEVLKLGGEAGAAERLAYALQVVERAKIMSHVSHFLALESIEHAVERFDDSFAGHMVVIRDFFGEFWQEIERRAHETAAESIREAMAWGGAARAFVIIDDETKGIVSSLRDPTHTPTIPEFLAKLAQLKGLFQEHPLQLQLWREAFEGRFGKLN